jgi:hypothetical protein
MKPRFALAPVVAAALAGCGGGAGEPAGLRVPLQAENNSGVTGSAELEPGEQKSFSVVLVAEAAEDGMHAHIHDVSCAEYRRIQGFGAQVATVADSLADFSDGRSESTVGLVELAARTTGGYSINVHEQNAPYDTVACGDIPKQEEDG